MNDRRREKFWKAACQTQPSISVILENIQDTHNVGAILRSCDAIGIRTVHVVNTTNDKEAETLTLGKRSSMGTRKWIDVHYYRSLHQCFDTVRKSHDKIYATSLDAPSELFHNVDYTGKVAIVMGNEKKGVSPEAIDLCDGCIYIPQVGLAESLNVSVAASVILYEMFKQRERAGKYEDNADISVADAEMLMKKFSLNIRNARKDSKHYILKSNTTD